MSDRMLAIGPSISDLGYCIMTSKFEILKCDLLKSRKENWNKKCEFMWAELTNICHKFFPKKVFLKSPEYFDSSVVYRGKETTSIFKLTFLCGGIYALLNEWTKVEIVTSGKWQGQLSEKTVRKRLKKAYPDFINDDINHNVIEAVAINHYMLKNSKGKL